MGALKILHGRSVRKRPVVERLAVVFLCEHAVDGLGEITAKSIKLLGAFECFVVAKETEDRARAGFGQPFIGAANVLFTLSHLQFVARITQVAKGEVKRGYAA